MTGRVEFPPGNRTDWDGIDQHDYDMLREYIRNVTYTPFTWKPSDCLPAFPASGNHNDVAVLQGLAQQAKERTELGNPGVGNGIPSRSLNTKSQLPDYLQSNKS